MVSFDNKKGNDNEKEIAMEKRHVINGDDAQAIILGWHLSSKPDKLAFQDLGGVIVVSSKWGVNRTFNEALCRKRLFGCFNDRGGLLTQKIFGKSKGLRILGLRN
jgi:hypothetical protein